MNEEPPGFGVTVNDLRSYDWMAVIREAAGAQCHHYGTALFAKAEGHREAGDSRSEGVCRLLATATAMPLDFAAVPPGLPQATSRFSSADIDALLAIFPEAEDPELQARLGDLIWECRRGRETRRVLHRAVEAYVLAGQRLEGAIWLPRLDRFRRALQLQAKFGLDRSLQAIIVAAIEELIEEHQATETGLMCARLMDLLAAYEAAEPARYIVVAEVVARRLEGAQHFSFAREYWEVKARWHFQEKDRLAALAARQAAAETYISEAEALALQPNPSYMNVCFHMGQGVEALMRAEADQQRIETVHRQLLDYQSRQKDELHSMPDPRDEIPGFAQMEVAIAANARARVSGVSLQEAILYLALREVQLVDPVELRRKEEALFHEYPMEYFVEVELFDDQGRTKGIRPAVSPWDAEQTEAAFTAAVFHHAGLYHWNPAAALQIEPAREQIEDEHALDPRDMAFLVMDNPFVPPDRAGLYARGLYAGFKGDLILAIHLLIPQIEHSIRHVLEERGTITSKLEDGIQDSHLLGTLLKQPEIAEVFGPEIAFTLRGVLVERFGFNLRNEVCHGFASVQSLGSAGALYLWWLVLHLCAKGPELLAKAGRKAPL